MGLNDDYLSLEEEYKKYSQTFDIEASRKLKLIKEELITKDYMEILTYIKACGKDEDIESLILIKYLLNKKVNEIISHPLYRLIETTSSWGIGKNEEVTKVENLKQLVDIVDSLLTMDQL
jgi:hypothetical protein